MHKIKILDENKEFIFNKHSKNKKKRSERFIKIKDSLFEFGLKKGLIEKDGDEYCFIGNFEKFLAFKNKRMIN